MGLVRGITVTAFFGIVLFVLIPVYVPRPNFIPGFAPPPDMWPRTISILGMGLGLLLAALSLSRKPQADADPEDAGAIRDGTPLGTLVLRFVYAVLAFAGFIVTVHFAGFIVASMALLFVMLLLTGQWQRKGTVVLVALFLPLVLYLFFSSALNTRFPAGSLVTILGL
ncbi:tripartite tricarboxylate transporter TctB family protein [Aidingimonas halophila]|uniref:Tripartite tricarboxylate transporter TctB family protein n=1 Tax=Aidingimonas halophila TaxID=574349 RepID=A0A1H3CXR1_9GAMM|nr:tripartite tricarboxylate transporter TctB family protein [Aidingimonas halophila]GHC30965.1 hypothetical protein GCM10008094_24270 [Aidingimonas halophila]SDX58229.1 Tripartite tricarboxylate transporter TctB family protein [Aidingimonas halophila]